MSQRKGSEDIPHPKKAQLNQAGSSFFIIFFPSYSSETLEKHISLDIIKYCQITILKRREREGEV